MLYLSLIYFSLALLPPSQGQTTITSYLTDFRFSTPIPFLCHPPIHPACLGPSVTFYALRIKSSLLDKGKALHCQWLASSDFIPFSSPNSRQLPATLVQVQVFECANHFASQDFCISHSPDTLTSGLGLLILDLMSSPKSLSYPPNLKQTPPHPQALTLLFFVRHPCSLSFLSNYIYNLFTCLLSASSIRL